MRTNHGDCAGADISSASETRVTDHQPAEVLHVACVADARYGSYAGITFWSVIRSNPDMKVHLHLFSDSVRRKDVARIRDMALKHNASCTVYDLGESLSSYPSLMRKLHYPRAAYGRLFIPNLVSSDIDFVLYLDCDVVCVGPLRGLWDLRHRVPVLAAVPDAWVTSDRAYKQSVGCDPDDVYYNSGVMLLNTKAWRSMDIFMSLIDYINSGTSHQYADQDAINAVLGKQVFQLAPCWNVLISAPDMSQIDGALDSAMNIHFCAGFKPWHIGYSLLGGLAAIHFRTAKATSPWRRKLPDSQLRRMRNKLIAKFGSSAVTHQRETRAAESSTAAHLPQNASSEVDSHLNLRMRKRC